VNQASELVADAVLRKAAQGDRPAQQEVLNEIHDLVRRTLYRLLLGRAEDLEDLQQAVLLRVLTSLASFRFESSFKTWVTAICINVFRDHLRRKQREPKFDHAIDGDELPARAEPGPLRRLQTGEALNRCAHILEGLPINQRTAFMLQAVHGHSVAEIAAIMGSATSTTRLRLYYARRAFRKALAATEHGPVAALSTQEGSDGTA
jgi:RNA polymerase sigma-70 factor (ECF subfamily)